MIPPPPPYTQTHISNNNNQESIIILLGSYKCQTTACLQDSLWWFPSSTVTLYAAAAWVGTQAARKMIYHTEQLQDQAVRFIVGIIIMGRDGVEDAKTKLRLFPLHKRTRDQRLKLLMRIIAKGKQHSSLSELYNEIITNQQRL